jgi:hypothetical protein
MQRRRFLLLSAGFSAPSGQRPSMEDSICGGFLGQLLGDLNGLQHEMKYVEDPGPFGAYTPGLPDGGFTDDDTDIEWVYILEIQRSGALLIPPARIAELWKRHINRRIWCSNLYVRQLMDLGFLPPETGNPLLNPWADFNLSGQFLSETWGLISPGEPRRASELAAWYTSVGVRGEPVQSARLFSAMVATAFTTSNVEQILDTGVAALNRESKMREVVASVRRWHRENPTDWRATRRLIRDTYTVAGGHAMRDRNGVILNGASSIAALLYGRGDFVETLRLAFHMGWDADNNAAVCGAILGVIRGERWLRAQGWNIGAAYKNTSRDNMPVDETITSYASRLVDIASRKLDFAAPAYHPPNYVLLSASILGNPGASREESARAAYVAICLGTAPEMEKRNPETWPRALAALRSFPELLKVATSPDVEETFRSRTRIYLQ